MWILVNFIGEKRDIRPPGFKHYTELDHAERVMVTLDNDIQGHLYRVDTVWHISRNGSGDHGAITG